MRKEESVVKNLWKDTKATEKQSREEKMSSEERTEEKKEDWENKWEMEVKKREAEEGGGLWKGKEEPKGRQRKRVEKVGAEEKCGKEWVKPGGNSCCCLSVLLLQVSDKFLLFCFLDAHSCASVSKPSMFLSGGLSSIPVWIKGIVGVKKKKHVSIYIYLKMD